MLYILECMALGILCMHSGIDMKMYTTGEEPTTKEVGVCMLCWLLMALVVLFIGYWIRYAYKKKAYNNVNDNNLVKAKENVDKKMKFSFGLLYLLECLALGILCMHGGIDRNLYTTGKKATFKEVIISFASWAYLSLVLVSVVFIIYY